MAKVKTAFCQNCGTQFAKWQGQCTACKEWNTITEELIEKPEKVSWKTSESPSANRRTKPLKINEIDATTEARLDTKTKSLTAFWVGVSCPGL